MLIIFSLQNKRYFFRVFQASEERETRATE